MGASIYAWDARLIVPVKGRALPDTGVAYVVLLPLDYELDDPSLAEDTRCTVEITILNVGEYVQEDLCGYIKQEVDPVAPLPDIDA